MRFICGQNMRRSVTAMQKIGLAVVAGVIFSRTAFSRDKDYEETAAFSRTIAITFDGDSAAVENQAGSGVSVSRNGTVLVFSNTIQQVSFVLTGPTAAGSVKIYSDHVFKLVLNNVALASTDGPAINIQSKKICYVVMPEGTDNALTDGSVYSTQYDATNGEEDAKAVLFSEGQLAFSGRGRLTVNGRCAEKHGICSDDYVRILDGDVHIAMTQKKSDGVHVNDLFRIDGGRLSVALALKGDGIDAGDDGKVQICGGGISVSLAGRDSSGIRCGTNAFTVAGGAVDITATAADCSGLSCDGVLAIRDGFVNVAMTESDCKAVNADGGVVVDGGDMAVSLSGAESKGIKTDGEATFNGGSVRMSLSGNTVLETVTNDDAYVYTDPAFCCGVKASNIVINAGTFTVFAEGRASRGFSADNDLTVNGGTLSIAATGEATATFTNASEHVDLAAAACLKADRLLEVRGGLLSLSVSGSAGKGLLAGAVLISGGRFDVDLSGPPAFVNGGNYLDPSYCAAVKSGDDAVISNGTFVIRHAGVAGRGFSVDNNMFVSGGRFSIAVTGANTAVYTCGVDTVNGVLNNVLDVGAASAIKVVGNLVIGGGAFDLLATGNCGKGINVSGTLTIGTNTVDAAPSITVATKGGRVALASATKSVSDNGLDGAPGGGPGGGGGGGNPVDDSEDYSNPKAIKATGKLFINNGTISVSTAAEGGEGLESKDTIVVNGGSIDATCYDDCINAATNITFNGGRVFCSSSDNDGIDSNGTFLFNGGVIASFGTKSPEEGLDCDQNTFTVNGGTFVGCGGATSYPNAGAQYSLAYTGTLTSNTVLRVTNSSGSSIFAFKMPRTYSSSVVVLCSASGFASSGTYTVYTDASMSGSDFHGLYTNTVSNASGGSSKGSDSTPSGRYYAVP